MDSKQLAMFIFGTVIVIAAAYYTTYFIASKGANLQRGRIIKIRDKTSLTKENALYIIEVGKKYYLIGSTSQSFTLLDTLDNELFEESYQADYSASDYSFMQTGFPSAKNNKLVNRIRDIARKNRPEEQADAGKPEQAVSIAKEEDDLDVVYRKIQTRRSASAAQSSKPDSAATPSFESFLNSGDK